MAIRGRQSKYRAQPTVVDGIRFASQREARRYQELRLLEKAGEIHGLELQPDYTLDVHGEWSRQHQIGRYVADFRYCICKRGSKCIQSQLIVEDAKGFKTPLYRWKKKHVEAQYGITIREV